MRKEKDHTGSDKRQDRKWKEYYCSITVRVSLRDNRSANNNISISKKAMILRSRIVAVSAAFFFLASANLQGSASAFMGVEHSSTARRFSSTTSKLSAAFEGTAVACTGPTCSKNGSKKALKVFEELAAQSDGKLKIETMNCVSECSECAMGPNVELRAEGDDGPFYPIKNKVKTEEDVKSILGLE
jgi:hypothetical protein